MLVWCAIHALFIYSALHAPSHVTHLSFECAVISTAKGVSSPVGTRGHATTDNNEIVMNLFMNLFVVS